MLFAEEAGTPCPFIMTGVERPLEIVLSTSIIVLLMLQDKQTHQSSSLLNVNRTNKNCNSLGYGLIYIYTG